MELVAWRAFASSQRALVLVEPSERTDAKVGEQFFKMWASLLLVAAGSHGWVVFVPNCIVQVTWIMLFWFVEVDQTSFTEIPL